MSHDDMRPALIYQRATSEADQLIADRPSGLVLTYRSRSHCPEERQAAAEIENEPETGTGSSWHRHGTTLRYDESPGSTSQSV